MSAYLPNPSLGPDMFLQALAEELGLKDACGLEPYRLLRRVNHALLDFRTGEEACGGLHRRSGRRCRSRRSRPYVCSPTSKLEKRKLLQIVLFGQPELDENCAVPRSDSRNSGLPSTTASAV